LSAYEDMDNEDYLMADHDDRSTRASSGGSEPVSSGSEDESEKSLISQTKRSDREKASVSKSQDTNVVTKLLAALRCERRADRHEVNTRSHFAAAVPVPVSEQVFNKKTTVSEPQWTAPQLVKNRAPSAHAIQHRIGADLSSKIQKPLVAQKKEAFVPQRPANLSAPAAPTLLNFPPGLEPVGGISKPPPGLTKAFNPPPGLEHPSQGLPAQNNAKPAPQVQPRYFPTTQLEVVPYSRKAFRKEMVAIFNDIRQARTASLNGAVHRVRAQSVPKEDQPALFSEMMTRAVEEMSGPGRRLCMAFVTGVAAGSPSAFDKECCLKGIKLFFTEVYDGLMDEVPKLPTRVEREFLPAFRTAFSVQELNEALPSRLRTAP